MKNEEKFTCENCKKVKPLSKGMFVDTAQTRFCCEKCCNRVEKSEDVEVCEFC